MSEFRPWRIVPPGVRRAVDERIGRLALFEMYLKVRRAHHLPRVTSIERREVARAKAAWGPRAAQAEVVTVIPTYRRPTLLRSAVESALAQTIDDHLVVVIDDCGGLPNLPRHPQLLTHSLSMNLGSAGPVRNIGIGSTSSSYLAFLDDDNTWREDHLRVSLACHSTDIGLTYTAIERHRPTGEVIDVLSTPFSVTSLRRLSYIDTNTMVARRTRHVRFSRLPRRRGDFPLEDWELAHRVSRHTGVLHIPEPTVRYLLNEASYFSNHGRDQSGQPPAGG